MQLTRWCLLGLFLAVGLVGHLAKAAPSGDNSMVGVWFDSDIADNIIDEEDIPDEYLDEIAAEIVENIMKSESGDMSRGFKSAFKVFGKGIKKGGKVFGSGMLSAGKKVIKVSGKGMKFAGKNIGKGFKKVGKGIGKGTIKLGKGMKKGIILGAKSTKTMVTKKGKKIWGGLKQKFSGDMAKAGKQLMKTVGKQVLETGFDLAVEAITPMIIEYAMEKTQEGLCSCEGRQCKCCAQPPGFTEGCLVIKARPRKQMFATALTYGGTEIAKLDIDGEEKPSVCAPLIGNAAFLKACVTPVGLGEIEDGIRGCMTVSFDVLPIERTLCVDFTGTPKEGSARFLNGIEMAALME